MLPCLAQTEHRYLRHAAWTGVVLISGTAALTIVLVWLEPGSRAMEKTMASGWIASAAAFARVHYPSCQAGQGMDVGPGSDGVADRHAGR